MIPEKVTIEGWTMHRGQAGRYADMLSQDSSAPEWMRKAYAFIGAFLDPGREAILQQSSGTTGQAKTYSLERAAMVTSAVRTLQYFGLQPGERVLCCLPVDYIAGKMMIVRALVGGLDLHLAEPGSTPLQSAKGDFRFASMVPLQLARSLEEGDNTGRIKTLLLGGGEIPPALMDRIAEIEDTEIYESFAMTETISHFALRRLNGKQPDTSFRILEGVRIARDERGCLQVDVEGVTRGPVQSNDLVEIAPNLQEFQWLGRADNLINSGGIKIIPEILEVRMQALLGHPCLLLPEADEVLGQHLVLLIEHPSAATADTSTFKKLLEEEFRGAELPRRIIPIHQIPRNASFKPDRREAARLAGL